MGALFDAVSAGLKNIDKVTFDRLPRMADFAKWVTACEPGLGWQAGTFIAAYQDNRATANESAIESSSIGLLILKLVEDRGFNGTAKELKEALEGMLPKDKTGNIKLPSDWPKLARSLSGEL